MDPSERLRGGPALSIGLSAAGGGAGKPAVRTVRLMTGFQTPAGEHFAIFGEGGGRELADELDVPLLARVPLTMPLREHADSGVPLLISDPEDPAARAIHEAARGLIAGAPMTLPALPVLEVIPVGSPPAAPAPDGERKPAGMSLPILLPV